MSEERQRGATGAWLGVALGTTWALTALRLVLIPLFLVLAARTGEAVVQGADDTLPRVLALWTLLAMGLSDVLDGFLARRWGVETRAGAIADAVADKGTQVAVLGYFALASAPGFWNVPLWFLGVLVGRDLLTLVGGAILRSIRGRGGMPVEHASHGRLASVLVFLLLIGVTAGVEPVWLNGLLWASAGAVVVSTLMYGRRALRWTPEDEPADPRSEATERFGV